ncbi:DUF4917 family protein [Halodesulfovibrio sp.]|jgi:hypothetical protein|uniref:DUF4917 family protein n=1 Tax=Halodesulfovibrio sp. TaxID=1912772 RepID=UPI0025D7DDE2|nr:DUF4917 family protein [Halodesulfovibrio sp.]MCT4627720.1 DUF4917 family protein [Halodesulfovibrio sp.]
MTAMSFEDALKSCGKPKPSILLGNGFSIAQSAGKFSYSNLREKCRFESKPLEELFVKLDTNDFEEVLSHIQSALLVAEHYDFKEIGEKLKTEAKALREGLISAIKEVHPTDYTAIEDGEIENCSAFIDLFSTVFTLNYDLLLYWVNQAKKPHRDGFGLGDVENFCRPFSPDGHCSIYNLHGGLHLFKKSQKEVEKAISSGGMNLIETISHVVNERGQLPIFVSEGSSDVKFDTIMTNKYLKHCYMKLWNLSGPLFIYGHSADKRDEHIYNAIFNDKSEVDKLFVCVHEPDKQLDQITEMLTPYIERNSARSKQPVSVEYVDSATVPVWK